MHIQRSKVYYKPAERSVDEWLRRESIMARIDHWHTQMPGIGTRKLVRQLKNEGFSVGRKLVRRLMGEMGIQAIYPKANLSKRNFRETIVPYLLRNKAVSLPNQVWSIDITYIKMQHSHMYLTAIIDWYSRMIVGWNLSDTLDNGYVIQAVKDAVAAHGTPAILNSDQGCQFTSNAYKTLLKGLHIRQSMDGKSRWADNVMIERWFRSLKTEEIYLNEYPTPRALRKATLLRRAVTLCATVARWLRRQNGLIWYYLVHDNFYVSGLDWGTIMLFHPAFSGVVEIVAAAVITVKKRNGYFVRIYL